MKHIKLFEELYTSGNNEKDIWWDRNSDKFIDIISTWSDNDFENLFGEEHAEMIIDETTPRNKAFYVFNQLSLTELDALLGKFMKDIDESKEVNDFDRFQLLKDIETDNGKLRKGKKFDSFGGLVCAVDMKIDGKTKSIRFDDKEYFKLVK